MISLVVPLLDWLAVAVMGALVGVIDLSTRYRDAPGVVTKSPAARYYLALNAFASIVALAIIQALGLAFPGANAATAFFHWGQVLIAGTAAMTILRVSFTLRLGPQDIQFSPATLLDSALTIADREVDRQRAEDRANIVKGCMQGVIFDSAIDALPTVCLALLQNLPQSDQDTLSNLLKQLRSSSLSNEVKSLALGLALMNFVGDGVLIAAVNVLGDQIKTARRGPEQLPGPNVPLVETAVPGTN